MKIPTLLLATLGLLPWSVVSAQDFEGAPAQEVEISGNEQQQEVVPPPTQMPEQQQEQQQEFVSPPPQMPEQQQEQPQEFVPPPVMPDPQSPPVADPSAGIPDQGTMPQNPGTGDQNIPI